MHSKKIRSFAAGNDCKRRPDVDLVLTTRELANLIKHAGIDFRNLEPGQPDSVLGAYTGAGHIFGVTGGVMEAALRTGYELITGKALDDINIVNVRHSEGIKRATIQVGDLTVKVVVVAGLANLCANPGRN